MSEQLSYALVFYGLPIVGILVILGLVFLFRHIVKLAKEPKENESNELGKKSVSRRRQLIGTTLLVGILIFFLLYFVVGNLIAFTM